MTCAHYWDIKIPEGPTSEGVCRHCGERRTFRNSVDDYAPAERSAKAHTMYCASLERRILAEVMKE